MRRSPAARESEGDLLVGRSPQMQEVVQGDGPRGAARCHCADSRRKRHGQRVGGPRHLSSQSTAPTDRFWRSTARRFPMRCSKANCSATRKARSPAPTSAASANSNNATAARCFWTRVGDMSPLVQSKVLRVLQRSEFERVGGNQTIRTDVRMITATNRDLEQMVEEGIPQRSLLSAERLHDSIGSAARTRRTICCRCSKVPGEFQPGIGTRTCMAFRPKRWTC